MSCVIKKDKSNFSDDLMSLLRQAQSTQATDQNISFIDPTLPTKIITTEKVRHQDNKDYISDNEMSQSVFGAGHAGHMQETLDKITNNIKPSSKTRPNLAKKMQRSNQQNVGLEK